MTGEQHIDYDQLAQDALRGLVRQVLSRIAKTGLPGQHHFYISFSTRAPGVALSARLKDRYPEEMTIVLQHRFWELIVSDERFEVQLTFDSVPERLVVPFRAIKVFFDPSVPYGLQFEGSDLAGGTSQDPQGELGQPVPTAPAADEKQIAPPTQTPVRADKKPRPRKPRQAKDVPIETVKSRAPAKSSQPAETARAPRSGGQASPAAPPQPAADNDTKVVHLDKFRKK